MKTNYILNNNYIFPPKHNDDGTTTFFAANSDGIFAFKILDGAPPKAMAAAWEKMDYQMRSRNKITNEN